MVVYQLNSAEYLSTIDVSFKFQRVDKFDKHLISYVDSDYAGDLDKHCSTTSYVFIMAGGLMS